MEHSRNYATAMVVPPATSPWQEFMSVHVWTANRHIPRRSRRRWQFQRGLMFVTPVGVLDDGYVEVEDEVGNVPRA